MQGNEYKKNGRKAGKILLPLLAVIAGAWSENGAIATIIVIVALTILIWKRNGKFPMYLATVCIVAMAGFVFLMLAPSEFGGRTGDLSSRGILESAKNCLELTEKYCLKLYVIYAVLLALAISAKVEKRAVAASAVLAAAGAFSVAVFAFAAYLPQRSFYILVTFTVLASLILLEQVAAAGESRLFPAFAAAMAALFVFSFVKGTGDIVSLKLQERARETQILEAVAEGNLNVTLKAYASSTMYPAAFAEELTEAPDGWYNGLLAKYYGISSVSGTGINYYFD